MDEFEYYCQLARSSGSKKEENSFLNTINFESSQRARSHSLLPTNIQSADKDELVVIENRRDSLQHPNFRTASMKENKIITSSKQNIDLINNDEESNQSLYRVRSLKKTSKGVINKGDSIRNYSNTSLEKKEINYSYPGSEYHTDQKYREITSSKVNYQKENENSSQKTRRSPYIYKGNSQIHWHQSSKPKSNKSTTFGIQVLGAPLVGKSSMCEQFLTSEYLGNRNDPNGNNESKTVTIDLDGEEYMLTFLDTVKDDDEDPNKVYIIPNADGYMIVYAIDEYDSFQFAKTILKHLRKEVPQTSTLFLVANKSDLERGREISSEDGKHLAKVKDCEFLEVSTALNHMVDDLLVQIIHSIRQQKDKFNDKKEDHFQDKNHKTRTNTITKFFRKHFSKNSQSTIDNH